MFCSLCIPSTAPVTYRGGMSDDDTTSDAAPDEVKRKFREALDKKNAKQRGGESHLDGQGPVHEPHGRAGHKREFRRKSG